MPTMEASGSRQAVGDVRSLALEYYYEATCGTPVDDLDRDGVEHSLSLMRMGEELSDALYRRALSRRRLRVVLASLVWSVSFAFLASVACSASGNDAVSGGFVAFSLAGLVAFLVAKSEWSPSRSHYDIRCLEPVLGLMPRGVHVEIRMKELLRRRDAILVTV